MTTTARRALPAIPTIDGTRSTSARAGAIQLATGLPDAGSSDIAAWVAAHGTLVESVGNGSLFDLSTVVARG